jgi:glucose-1-phosphate adenylyltransferase
VFQNIYSIAKSGAKYVLVLAADHVYKMDYRSMLEFHRESGGAVTVGTLRVPVAEAAGQFGVVEVDRASQVVNFKEKPERPACLPGDEAHCLASMGIYVFTASYLIDELRRSDAEPDPGHDFGQHFLPRIVGREPVRAFTFSGNGTGTPYWRDVGTLDAYFRANMDLLAEAPELDLYDKAWPIYSFHASFPPARVAITPVSMPPPSPGLRHNIVANGTVADGWLRGAVVGFDCRIAAHAVVEQSILFDGASVGSGAAVRRAILDEGVQVRPGARIGFDPDEDQRRGFLVSEDGITCVPADAVVEGRSKATGGA